MVGDMGLDRIVGCGGGGSMLLGHENPVNFPAFNIIILQINFTVKQQTLNLIDAYENFIQSIGIITMEIEFPKQSKISDQNSRTFGKKFKFLISFLLIVSFIGYRFGFPQPNVQCITDAYHDSTQSLNRDLVRDPGSSYEGNFNPLTGFGKFFIGLGQVLMDLWIFILGVIWLFKIKNLRYLGGIAMFYLIRGTIFLNVEKFPFPEDIAWRSPGFFSVTVPYDHTRDFFFSGHCGGLTVICCELITLGYTKIKILAFLSLLYMANMLLVTKVHYSIDIIAGIIFALWFYRLSQRITYYLDYLFTLPKVGVQKIIACLKGDEEPDEITVPSEKGQSQENNEKAESNEKFDDFNPNQEVLHEEIQQE